MALANPRRVGAPSVPMWSIMRIAGCWDTLERLSAEFAFGGWKTGKTDSWGFGREATHCATGIYVLLSAPATRRLRAAGYVW